MESKETRKIQLLRGFHAEFYIFDLFLIYLIRFDFIRPNLTALNGYLKHIFGVAWNPLL
jgi:hypothetical protein